jgi:hypothetical protein
VRVCHPNTQWAVPLKMSSHPNSTVMAIPAAGGVTMARIPARIISVLKPMDHPSDFFIIAGMGVDVTLMTFLRRSFRIFRITLLRLGKTGGLDLRF